MDNLIKRYKGKTTSEVQAWERGRSTPKKMACRFMDLIRSNTDYWREILHHQFVLKAR